MSTSPIDALPVALLTRLEAESFLIEEAALLDNWRLDEWFELFTEDARYVVPSTDFPHGNPATDLTLIDDDHLRLRWRVNRLKSRHAHREFPWSRTRRLITNVRVVADRDDELDVEASVLVYRFRHGHQDPFVGLYRYTLLRAEGGSFKIRLRRAELDMERLSPNGALSMIL
ncbi:MAG: aromatic-ring-hydroxylating dioxygenase subunit beta [Solirubrobacteraceae bacterium]